MTYGEWIHANRRKFLDGEYDIKDMIVLSFAAGWNRHEIAKTLRHWPRALWVSDVDASVERIAKQQTEHFEQTIKRMKGLSLADQWHDLYEYIEHGKTWEDKL